jgi:HlyD family secretion protein
MGRRGLEQHQTPKRLKVRQIAGYCRVRQRTASTTAALALFCLSCSSQHPESYQGYCEGEFVYLSSSQPGQLAHLAVWRGAQVTAGALLFALEAVEETAAQQQARGQLAAAEAQLADLQTGKRPPEVAVTRAQLVTNGLASSRASCR